jgi:hypothetical protein
MTEDQIFLGWSRASGVPICAGRKGVLLGISSALDPGFNFRTLWSLLLSDEPASLSMSPVSLQIKMMWRPTGDPTAHNRHRLLKHRLLIQVPPLMSTERQPAGSLGLSTE